MRPRPPVGTRPSLPTRRVRRVGARRRRRNWRPLRPSDGGPATQRGLRLPALSLASRTPCGRSRGGLRPLSCSDVCDSCHNYATGGHGRCVGKPDPNPRPGCWRSGNDSAGARWWGRALSPNSTAASKPPLVSLVHSGEYSTLDVAEPFGVGRSTVYRAIERQRIPAKDDLAEATSRQLTARLAPASRLRHPSGTPACLCRRRDLSGRPRFGLRTPPSVAQNRLHRSAADSPLASCPPPRRPAGHWTAGMASRRPGKRAGTTLLRTPGLVR